MAGSTLPEVKRSIVDELDARLGSEWTVTYGWPGDKLARRCAWLGSSTVNVATTSMRGDRRRRTEEPVLTLSLWAMEQDASASSSDRQQTADEAVIEALRLVDEWIADEGQLGRPDIVDMCWLVSWRHDIGPTERGDAALIVADIRYQSRLL